MTRVRRTVGLPLAVALVAVAAGCVDDPPPPEPDGPVQAALFRFETFASAPGVSGGEVVLDELRGNVVALHLFNTWSAACRSTAPIMVSLYERYRNQRFEIVGLVYGAAEPAEARRAVERFGTEFKIPFTLAFGPDILWQELRREAGVTGQMPTIVLMDRQGVVRDVFEGLPPGYEQVLADRIERLLAEPYVPLLPEGAAT